MSAAFKGAAFKEWKSVCDVLERGEQTIILRKGGIAEGKQGFLWQHKEFFLFPTAFHNHREQLKNNVTVDDACFDKNENENGKIEVRLSAKIIWSADLNDLQIAQQLAPFHAWKDEVIEQRFDYSENKGIRLALLRVSRLPRPWILDERPAFGGCRSWLNFPDPSTEHQRGKAVINDADFANQQSQLEQVLKTADISITLFDQ